MRVNLMGKQLLDFTSGDGKPIRGTNLFVAHPADGVEGVVCKKFFVSIKTELPAGLEIGKALDIYFNDKKQIEHLALAK